MPPREPTGAEGRTLIYCVVPYDLAARLHEPLREHFKGDPSVEVVVERRGAERRRLAERRAGNPAQVEERRRIRNAAGRRVGPRRAPAVAIDPRALPRKARAHADRIAFLERVEPGEEHLADLDSARLVTRFQSGDQDAFGELYTRYFDRVYGYLRAVFRPDTHEVEDLTQQVFMRAFEALPRYERGPQPFRAWLFTIVRNVARTQLGRRGRTEPVDPSILAEQRDDSPSEPGVSTLAWLTDREIVMFVERLPLAQRQVLILKYMLDLPGREIAQILARSHDDVRMLEHRALRFLEKRLRAVGWRAGEGRPDRSLPSYGRIRWAPVLRRRGSALRRNPGRVRI